MEGPGVVEVNVEGPGVVTVEEPGVIVEGPGV